MPATVFATHRDQSRSVRPNQSFKKGGLAPDTAGAFALHIGASLRKASFNALTVRPSGRPEPFTPTIGLLIGWTVSSALSSARQPNGQNARERTKGLANLLLTKKQWCCTQKCSDYNVPKVEKTGRSLWPGVKH
jgi:hypothetical protein